MFKSFLDLQEFFLRTKGINYSKYFLKGFNLITEFQEITEKDKLIFLYSDQEHN